MVDYSTVVEKVVDQLFRRFRTEPSLFFTESDLVCEFYRLFLSQVPDPYVKDADCQEHIVIHTEYPTPFRCDMSNLGFITKGDEDKKDGRGKFKRGHLDLAILNPKMISELRTREVMLQDFELAKEKVLNKVRPGRPMVLYALEFQYLRLKLTHSGANRFVDTIKQDHRKLAACNKADDPDHGVDGFVERYESLVFVREPIQAGPIEERIREISGIRVCSP